MPCRGCRGTATARTVPTRTLNAGLKVDLSGPDLTIIYEGGRSGTFSVNSQVNPRQKIRVRRGHPFVVNPGDAWIATMKDYRLITLEEESAPSFPETPPVIAPATDTPMPDPQISVIGLSAPDELSDLPLSEGKVQALRDSGFLTLDSIRADITENNAEGVRSIKGFGTATVRKLANAVL